VPHRRGPCETRVARPWRHRECGRRRIHSQEALPALEDRNRCRSDPNSTTLAPLVSPLARCDAEGGCRSLSGMTEGLRARPDAEVVDAVLRGHVDAFGILLGRYRDTYTRFAVRMLGSLEDADDALQSAFVRAFRNLGKCQDPARFGAWLYQIVTNECRTFATRRSHRATKMVRDEIALEQAEDAQPTPDVALRDEIQRALDQLPTEQREAFVLKFVEELSYEEMAELTGAGVSALKMRVKRACDRLRELLEGVHHD
jgi:RNA polymerase sigma-70 factor (ECF subfamily)